MLVDNAGWHVAKRLSIPPDVVLHRLPRGPAGLPAFAQTAGAEAA